MDVFSKIDRIVSARTINGVCTSSAILALLGEKKPIDFCLNSTVDRVEIDAWGIEPQNILLVDLAVNECNPEMTVEFLRRITDAGHIILGVLDEHNAHHWQDAFVKAELNYAALEIKPVTGRETWILKNTRSIETLVS